MVATVAAGAPEGTQQTDIGSQMDGERINRSFDCSGGRRRCWSRRLKKRTPRREGEMIDTKMIK